MLGMVEAGVVITLWLPMAAAAALVATQMLAVTETTQPGRQALAVLAAVVATARAGAV
jgi:hypothetical protein